MLHSALTRFAGHYHCRRQILQRDERYAFSRSNVRFYKFHTLGWRGTKQQKLFNKITLLIAVKRSSGGEIQVLRME